MLLNKPLTAADSQPAAGLGRSSEGARGSGRGQGSGGGKATAIFGSFDEPTPPYRIPQPSEPCQPPPPPLLASLPPPHHTPSLHLSPHTNSSGQNTLCCAGMLGRQSTALDGVQECQQAIHGSHTSHLVRMPTSLRYAAYHWSTHTAASSPLLSAYTLPHVHSTIV